MPGPASVVLLTVTGLEALVLMSRLPWRRGRAEHLRLLFLVLTLAADEIATPALARGLCMLAVATAQGNVLAPRHPLTRVQNLVAVGSLGILIALALAGVPLATATIVLLVTLECFVAAQLWLERKWMGASVFAALVATGLLWLGGRIAGTSMLVPGLPSPGLPLAVALIPAVGTWWSAPDGPLVSRWRVRAAGLEGRLERAERLLQTQSRLTALGFVAAGAAHEFRAALSGIGAIAKWAQSSPSPASKDEALALIGLRAEGAHRAVVPLLEQISGGEREKAGPVDLSRDLTPLLSFVRATCRRDGIGLTFQATGSPRVFARRGETEHILMNLLRNAAEASRVCDRDGRTIRVRVSQRNGEGVVEVEDDAGGVAADRQADLFRPATTNPGSGVGLFIARGLAQRNGGLLSYEPRPGGSLFSLCLPLYHPGGAG